MILVIKNVIAFNKWNILAGGAGGQETGGQKIWLVDGKKLIVLVLAPFKWTFEIIKVSVTRFSCLAINNTNQLFHLIAQINFTNLILFLFIVSLDLL